MFQQNAPKAFFFGNCMCFRCLDIVHVATMITVSSNLTTAETELRLMMAETRPVDGNCICVEEENKGLIGRLPVFHVILPQLLMFRRVRMGTPNLRCHCHLERDPVTH